MTIEANRVLALPDSYMAMDCGCEAWLQPDPDGEPGEVIFVFRPHSMTCDWYLRYLKLSAEQAKPVYYQSEEQSWPPRRPPG